MLQRKTAIAVSKAFALMLIASSAQALPTNLVTNGSFEQTTYAAGQSGFMDNNATGWTTDTYTFLVAPGRADVQMNDAGSDSTLKLWSTNNGGNNAVPATSPDGGRFVVADGAFGVGPISQTINGLNVGSQYSLSFYYAAGQQYSYDGPTTEAWKVSFGGQTQQTSTINLGNHNFADWQQASFTYTATSSSQVLSFLAVGTPSGLPPFVLLDGVSLTAPVPEPEEWAMTLVGVGLVSYQVRRKQAQLAALML
jgi:hypothetical protein